MGFGKRKRNQESAPQSGKLSWRDKFEAALRRQRTLERQLETAQARVQELETGMSELLTKAEGLDGEVVSLKADRTDLIEVLQFYAGNFDGREGTHWKGETFFFETKFGTTEGTEGPRFAREVLRKIWKVCICEDPAVRLSVDRRKSMCGICAREYAPFAWMKEVSEGQIKKLREETGCGMHDAKRGLELRGGNYELAREWVLRRGLAAVMSEAARFPLYNAWLRRMPFPIVADPSLKNRAEFRLDGKTRCSIENLFED